MIAQAFEYSAPMNLDEALKMLADGQAKVLAGGMSLIPLMKLRLAAPEHLIDLRNVRELREIREEAGAMHIGALVTHYQIETSPELRARCPLLPETAAHIGDMHVRNMGTIGGSVAHADPAADYPAALLALEAKVRLRRAGDGDRTLAIGDFLVDTLTTAIEPGEVITEVIVPAESAGTGVSYQKFVHPASGFAVTGVAARVRTSGGRIEFARVGVTGVAPRAFRAGNVEARLTGSDGSPAAIQEAAGLAAEGVDANSDLYASAEYRRQLARVLTGRALIQALSRLA